jgi:hypothetical protein
MNVVYRGCKSNDYIFHWSISADKDLLHSGLSSAGGGKYNIRSTTEVVIDVTGTLPDGSKVSDKKTFRIKGIP